MRWRSCSTRGGWGRGTAVGVFEEEAVLGDVMVGAGGEPPPEAGAVAVAGEGEQAGEDEGTGFIGVLAGDEGGEVPVGVGAEQSRFTDPRLCAAIVDGLTFGGNVIGNRRRLLPPRPYQSPAGRRLADDQQRNHRSANDARCCHLVPSWTIKSTDDTRAVTGSRP